MVIHGAKSICGRWKWHAIEELRSRPLVRCFTIFINMRIGWRNKPRIIEQSIGVIFLKLNPNGYSTVSVGTSSNIETLVF